MKFYLEITMLNQMIFKTKEFPDFQRLSRENAEITAQDIFNLNWYTVGDVTFPVSQIAYITVKQLN